MRWLIDVQNGMATLHFLHFFLLTYRQIQTGPVHCSFQHCSGPCGWISQTLTFYKSSNLNSPFLSLVGNKCLIYIFHSFDARGEWWWCLKGKFITCYSALCADATSQHLRRASKTHTSTCILNPSGRMDDVLMKWWIIDILYRKNHGNGCSFHSIHYCTYPSHPVRIRDGSDTVANVSISCTCVDYLAGISSLFPRG